ncbi:hypothetical protein E2320_009505 [Naja naja]|nr:hypothetical protein E2320_009505 [Naja naja]
MGGEEEEVLRIAKRLDKMVARKSVEGAMDLLKELKSMPITLHLLQSTRIGMSVNALRKQSTDEDVIALAKSLIKAWKKLLDASEDKRDEKKKNSLSASSSKETGDSRDQSSIKRQESVKTPTTPKITTFPPVPITCDTVRGKCRNVNFALQTDNVKNTDLKYKNRIRSRLSNLKDSRTLTSEERLVWSDHPRTNRSDDLRDCHFRNRKEMASNELKEIRKAMTKEAIREHQMAKTGGTQTDLFTCGKCKKKNCTYTQVQTRSSDEPMTTFVFC